MRRSILAAMGCLLLLTACGSSSDEAADQDAVKQKKEEEAKEAVAAKKPLPICPQVAIVRALDDIKDYGNEKPAPEQLVSEARMENVDGTCGYQKADDNDLKQDGVDIKFDLNFIAARGPRMGGTHGSFPFFIAVLDPDQNILSKEPMTEEFTFPDDKDKITAEKTENLHVFIPLPHEQRDTGPNYQVLLGFQLTQDQLDAIRAAKKLPE